ncbi:MAG: ABC transporter substrate-binding protein [Planktomarina sp.]|jgi:polar amino acid transport system substrate-binding protein|nr:ABC transporter substrate-binding protein [Planktomarina sp.]MDT2073886.1 ABC transporter substrate-binding protein [Planktomarina sp.]MDT2078064.1 ABC transporter substrate-binding protein [Planktomarina sp.]|tara:strand:- start:2985 stop:3830 length:846 start_codon:yes stop_codon:yes gene_type:complete
MKHNSLLILATVVAFGTTSTVAVAQDCPVDLPVIEAGVLTMSINATIPPKQFINEQGELQGLHVDLGNEIANRLCLEPNYQNVDFAVQIPGLDANRWDMINTGLYFTDKRAGFMQLVPFSVNALALIAADGNPTGITGPEDMAGKVVGVEIAGFEERKIREINDAQIAKGLASMDIRAFNTYGEVFLALGGGQIDAVFAGDAIGSYYQEKGQFSKAATGLFPGTPGAFAFDEPVLAQAVADALNAMRADGTYDSMMDAYGTTKMDAWDRWPGKFTYFYTGE